MQNFKDMEKLTSLLKEKGVPAKLIVAAERSHQKALLEEPKFLKRYYRMAFRLFVDMDGVICDWMKQYKAFGGKPFTDSKDMDWEVTESVEFWSTMPWKEKGKDLWELLTPLNPILLSAPGPLAKFSREGKQEWVRKEIGESTRLILENDKAKYATSRSILIDDMDRNTKPWEKAGGEAILYKGNPTYVVKKLLKIVQD